MSNLEPMAAGRNGALEILCSSVEEAAVRIVLGTLDSAERLAHLKGICAEAELAGRQDVAQVINDALDRASQSHAEIDPLLSGCVTRIQHMLSETGAESANCQMPSNSAAEAPSPVSLGEDRELLDLTGVQHDLEHVQPAIYRKRGGNR